ASKNYVGVCRNHQVELADHVEHVVKRYAELAVLQIIPDHAQAILEAQLVESAPRDDSTGLREFGVDEVLNDNGDRVDVSLERSFLHDPGPAIASAAQRPRSGASRSARAAELCVRP